MNEAMALGAKAYLVKPKFFEDILDEIEKGVKFLAKP